jgi:superfamily I DNA and/or RNA helicase
MFHSHFAKLAQLLDLEAAAEAERLAELARQATASGGGLRGNCLNRLVIRDTQAALGGRVELTLGPRDQTATLPWHRFESGTPVVLTEEQVREARPWRGIVSHRTRSTLSVMVADVPETEGSRPTFRIDLAADEIARQRMHTALRQAGSAERGRLAQLRQILLHEQSARFDPPRPWQPLGSDMNASQRAAVELALSARDVAIVHGPPGTGKTTTVVELIRQAVLRGERVLAVAASNMAVDHLAEKLIAGGERVVRLGHPTRVVEAVRDRVLDVLVERDPNVEVARRLTREAFALRDRAARTTRAKPVPGARQEMRQEARAMLADARQIELGVVRYLLDSAGVLCATLTGLDSALLEDRTFDLVVIDEAAQAIEPACWIPLCRANRVVLAGDHCQLPPTILSPAAARGGLEVSLLERLMQRSETPYALRLDTQYRMHAAIMEFSSQMFYEGSLIAHDSVREHTLAQLPGVQPLPITQTPVWFVDTAGASYDEVAEESGSSRTNPAEADWIVSQVESLRAAGVPTSEMAIIAPYAAQVRLLRDLLADEALEIDTVDGFQGREKEVVLISLVRSNNRGEIGFLADTRRLNVALTRARRAVRVIGDSSTLGGHPFFEQWLRFFEQLQAYGTVWD